MNNNSMKYLPLAVLAGSFLIGFGSLQSDVSTIQSAMAQDDVRERKDTEENKEVAKDIASLKTDVHNIKSTLDRLERQAREDKKEILDAIRKQ